VEEGLAGGEGLAASELPLVARAVLTSPEALPDCDFLTLAGSGKGDEPLAPSEGTSLSSLSLLLIFLRNTHPTLFLRHRWHVKVTRPLEVSSASTTTHSWQVLRQGCSGLNVSQDRGSGRGRVPVIVCAVESLDESVSQRLHAFFADRLWHRELEEST